MCGITGIALPDGQRPDRDTLVRAMADAPRAPRPRRPRGALWTAAASATAGSPSSTSPTPRAQPMATPDDARHAHLQRRGLRLRRAARRPSPPSASVPFALRHRGAAARAAPLGHRRARAHPRDVRLRPLGRARDRALVLARDRFGKKPLYYAPLGDDGGRGGLPSRASSRPPRAPGGARPSAPSTRSPWRSTSCTSIVPQPRSILANVRKLGPGEMPRWTRPRPRRERYYARATARGCVATTASSAEELSRRVDRAVARRLVADVPVGVFL
jgi:hypothetical protein